MGAVVLGLTAAVAGPLQPAQALNSTSAPMTTWTYVDSARPSTPRIDPAGDVPVGARQDGGVERALLTYDLSGIHGQKVHRADLYSSERSVADCGRIATAEVWQTGAVDATTTWQHQPDDIELIARHRLGTGATTLCPGAGLNTDVLAQVSAAVGRGDATITFGVRLAAADEDDPAARRTFRKPLLSIGSNHVPTVTGLKLTAPDRPCGTLADHPPAAAFTRFFVKEVDPDPLPGRDFTFAVWPVERPDLRAEFKAFAYDLSAYPDGSVLAWTARAADGDDVGPWGPTCYLTVDKSAPAQGPAVLSKRYPTKEAPGTGGQGVPGVFLLDARGDLDVVAFEYREDNGSATTVPAKRPGGRAKVTVTPPSPGPHRIEVRSADAVGNLGPWTTYQYWVRTTVSDIDIEENGVGLPSRITMRSDVPEVTAFGFAVADGPETRVPSVDGVGTSEIVFTEPGPAWVAVRVYAGRKMIGLYRAYAYVVDEPQVASDEFGWDKESIAGQAGTWRFAPRRAGVVAYEYDFGDGGTRRIDAAADGTAVVPWTPSAGGYYTLTVVSVGAAGDRSQQATDSFWVNSDLPQVQVTGGTGPMDGVGVPILVELSCALPGVTGFVYRFDDGPEQTVPLARTTVRVTPTHAGANSFTAWAVKADGSRSVPTTVSITVTTAPVLTVAGPYGATPVLDREATFTFRPALPDVVSYRYTWDFGETWETAEAGSGGGAAITHITRNSYDFLLAASVSADGTESDFRQYEVTPASPRVLVSGSWNESAPTGAAGVPGSFRFTDELYTAAVAYLWRIDDGPVQEFGPVTAYRTDVPWTPESSGRHTLHVQAKFTDGVLSPATAYPFLVGP